MNRYRDILVPALKGALRDEGPLGEMLRYHMGLVRGGPGIGGKLLRPSLVCFSCEASGGDPTTALPLAVALELVHNFSLIHDDIQDKDELRRGRPTVWAVYGVEQAINAGDGMLVLALRQALGTENLSETQRLTALGALLSATYRMIEGQVLDLSLEGRSADVAEYLDMARKKTGALIGCALELGGIAAGVDGELRTELRELGEVLGLAFQVRDDWIGIWGDPRKVGKPVGSDIARGKRSLPLVLALGKDPSLADLLDTGPLPLEEILGRLEGLGIKEETVSITREFRDRAAERLERLPWPNWAQEAFRELLDFLVEREA
ncbi:polyprenyl synthetase family protein [Candidatus Bipolaricaulota bacterium]|nr:polyprenyl synthetase family protein [Candidatus Bipolaricaulota bacterium]